MTPLHNQWSIREVWFDEDGNPTAHREAPQPSAEPCEPAEDGVCERLDCPNHDDTGRDWSLLEATQESLREHMEMIQKDTALLRQALAKLEDLRVTVDAEWGYCRDLVEIDAAGDQWPVVIAIRERLGETK